MRSREDVCVGGGGGRRTGGRGDNVGVELGAFMGSLRGITSSPLPIPPAWRQDLSIKELSFNNKSRALIEGDVRFVYHFRLTEPSQNECHGREGGALAVVEWKGC